jgi:hypothetical protein
MQLPLLVGLATAPGPPPPKDTALPVPPPPPGCAAHVDRSMASAMSVSSMILSGVWPPAVHWPDNATVVLFRQGTVAMVEKYRLVRKLPPRSLVLGPPSTQGRGEKPEF